MRIAFIINSSGGLYKFRKELILRMLSLGNEVYALAPAHEWSEELKSMGVQLIDIPIDRRGMNPIRDFDLCRRYHKFLKDIHADLVVTYTIKPNIYGGILCRLMRVPYALNITGLGTAFQNPGPLRTMITLLYRAAARKAKVVFFENDANRQVFIRYGLIRKEQACLLQGAGVNTEYFTAAEYPDHEVFRFLFIGRIMAEKGINELYAAMKRLHEDKYECALDILGTFDDSYENETRSYESEGWLFYHGLVDDIRPYITQSDCFVLPSWHEGMANTNLECAASGRPIITSNIPGCKEAVIDGVSGLLCDSKNADSLYQAMRKMMETPREERRQMGLAGRKHMLEAFDKKKVVEQTINHLEVLSS